MEGSEGNTRNEDWNTRKQEKNTRRDGLEYQSGRPVRMPAWLGRRKQPEDSGVFEWR